jgi:hypothetical protein
MKSVFDEIFGESLALRMAKLKTEAMIKRAKVDWPELIKRKNWELYRQQLTRLTWRGSINACQNTSSGGMS